MSATGAALAAARGLLDDESDEDDGDEDDNDDGDGENDGYDDEDEDDDDHDDHDDDEDCSGTLPANRRLIAQSDLGLHVGSRWI